MTRVDRRAVLRGFVALAGVGVEALGREPEGARSIAVVLGLVFEAAYGDPA
jgi:hypothetical protein